MSREFEPAFFVVQGQAHEQGHVYDPYAIIMERTNIPFGTGKLSVPLMSHAFDRFARDEMEYYMEDEMSEYERQAIREYKGMAFRRLNQFVQGRGSFTEKENVYYSTLVRRLDRIFANKSIVISKQIVVYRGVAVGAADEAVLKRLIDVQHSTEMLHDLTVRNKSYQSTSLDFNRVAYGFAGCLQNENCIIMQITVAPGTPILWMDTSRMNMNEREVLLPRGLKMKLENAVKITIPKKHKTIHIIRVRAHL